MNMKYYILNSDGGKLMANKGRTKILKRKKVIIIIISIVIVIILFWWIASQIVIIKFASPDDFKLTISTDQEIINKTQNESLWVGIKLTNVADDNLFIPKEFTINGFLEYKITIPSNKTIFPRHSHANLTLLKKARDYWYLSPSKSINTTVDIFDYEYSVGQSGNDTDLYDWNETGKYKIQFEYEYFQSGDLKSNIIEFWLKN